MLRALNDYIEELAKLLLTQPGVMVTLYGIGRLS
jgi:hypothetical protein